MKFYRSLLAFTSILIILCPGLQAQADKFSKPAHFNDLHTVYTYQKSNWDGTHSSTIFLYVKDTNELESFKWAEGDKWATLVSAEADWKTFSIKHFQNHRVYNDGKRVLVAELVKKNSKKLWIEAGDYKDSMTLADEHWQSYDFDFAGLGFSWRALKNKKESFSFHRADVGMVDNKPVFQNKGMIQVDYLGTETLHGKNCLKYKIDGPGLENKGGHIWINPDTYMIELYRIALPDEDGFVNGQLKLLQSEKLSPAAWKKFINEKMEIKQD